MKQKTISQTSRLNAFGASGSGILTYLARALLVTNLHLHVSTFEFQFFAQSRDLWKG